MFTGMWSTSFYFGNFVGPTAAGFMVDEYGFRNTTMLFFAFYALFFLIDLVSLCWQMTRVEKKGKQNDTNGNSDTNGISSHLIMN